MSFSGLDSVEQKLFLILLGSTLPCAYKSQGITTTRANKIAIVADKRAGSAAIAHGSGRAITWRRIRFLPSHAPKNTVGTGCM